MRPWVGVSLMMEPEFLQAMYPLFQNEEVEMLEWSFDIVKEGYKPPVIVKQLLQEYTKRGRLVGHGVRYSLLSGSWGARQTKWLNYLKADVKKNKYRYFTEHFGFMSHSNFHKGAPLPMPLTPKALQIGQDRLMRLQEVVQIPVGLENLAFAFNAEDVKEQGDFLNK